MGTGVIVRIDDVTKRYRHGRGIEHVSFDVHGGEVFGFLGPNGAGKSTTLRLLVDLIRPDGGTISVFGLDARRDSLAIRRRLGYLPGELALYERLTAAELLGHISHLRGGVPRARVAALVERLAVPLDRPIASLSRGNKQKVGLVQAFLGDPDLIVLDEPTSGLDPLVQHQVLQMMEEARHRGAAVLLSSHVLAEVDRVADRVGIIRDGRLIATEEVTALRERAVHRAMAILRDPVGADDLDRLTNLVAVRNVSAQGSTLHLEFTGEVGAILGVLFQMDVIDLTIGEPDLEDVFLSYYQEAGDASR